MKIHVGLISHIRFLIRFISIRFVKLGVLDLSNTQKRVLKIYFLRINFSELAKNLQSHKI